ncbi:MAG: chromate efflux transporter [Caldilineales bacterium]|nr:chromate efflux transporter [Caldilineales bacterium]MCW5857191.1 chromate efflux transporter [Caldilineales bacterium]
MSSRLGELAAVFLKLGVTGFGGPAAHIAMMEDEVVTRRGWLERAHFLDLMAATNLIPGPNSTEMTMHVGFTRARLPGLVVAGASFILPAALITGLIAWFYVRFGGLPQVERLLWGTRPVVIVIILAAVWKLGRSAVKNGSLLGIGLAVAAAALAGLNEVAALFAGGLLGMVWLRWQAARERSALAPALALPLAVGGAVPLWQVGAYFLFIGSVLYGSGYVLYAFLQGGLVQNLGWLSEQQLIDAIAVGQFTPGPLLSTATFVGYVVAGWQGAVVATVAIFLPSFFFVWALNPLVPRLRRSPWMAAFLDAVTVSAVALMLVVAWNLGRLTLTTWQAWLLLLVGGVLFFRFRLNAAWLVLGGALAGWLASVLTAL